MAMNNYYRRNNSKTKANPPDCFKPWQTQRNKSCSPPRNPKFLTNTHCVAFADKSRASRTLSPRKANDSLHTIFLKHLRSQMPKAARYHPQLQTMYKREKDNENVNIKLKNEAVHPNLKFGRNVYFDDDIKLCNSSTKNKHPKLKFGRNVNFEDDIKLCSLSATNLSSSCRIKSVRNVIEKFNNLSKPATNEPPKLSFQEKKKDIVPIPATNEPPKLTFQEKKRYIVPIPATNEPPKLSFHEKKKDIVPIPATNEPPKLSFQEKKKKDIVPIHEVETKIQPASNKEPVEKINNDKNRKISKNKLSGTQLRSKVYYKEREYAKLFSDDLLDLFKPAKMKSTQTISSKNLVPNMSNSKELVSSQTQTTPHPSATNIMINVYNQQSPSPRLIQHGNVQLSPMEIKICQDRNQNTKLSISQDREKQEFEVTKRSVRECVKKFEEHLKKNGMEPEKEINDSKIFAQIRSNYLLKKQDEPILSPKAKSVPF